MGERKKIFEIEKPECFGHYFEMVTQVCWGPAAGMSGLCDALCKHRDNCMTSDLIRTGTKP
jgi:hypothetical protein